MSEKCFKKCINKPGTSLDSSENVRKTNLIIFKLGSLDFFLTEMLLPVR